MTRDETIERNLTLTFDFIKEVIKRPTLLDEVDNDSLIEFVEKDKPLTEKILAKTPDKYFKVKHQFETF